MDQGDAADDGVAGAVRAAMGEGARAVRRARPDRAAGASGASDQAGDAAHQGLATAARKSRQRGDHGCFGEVRPRSRRGRRRPGLAASAGSFEHAARCPRQGAMASVERDEHAGAVRRRSARRGRPTAAATTGRPAEKASMIDVAERLAAGGADEHVAGGQQGGGVGAPAEQVHAVGDAGWSRARRSRAARSGPSPAMTAWTPGRRVRARISTSKRLVAVQAAQGEHAGAPWRGRQLGARVGAGQVGRRNWAGGARGRRASPGRGSSRRCRACCRRGGRSGGSVRGRSSRRGGRPAPRRRRA